MEITYRDILILRCSTIPKHLEVCRARRAGGSGKEPRGNEPICLRVLDDVLGLLRHILGKAEIEISFILEDGPKSRERQAHSYEMRGSNHASLISTHRGLRSCFRGRLKVDIAEGL